jgi:ribosome biogenesis GTPase
VPTLETLGWTERVAREFEPHASDGLLPARVTVQHQHVYRVLGEDFDLLARVSGRFRHAALTRDVYPAVGDWVAIRRTDTGGATIHAVLPRTSRFSRKVAGSTTEEQVVAANVETIFLVMGLDNDYSPRRIERYMAIASASGARPVILLTKADLLEPAAVDERVREIAVAAPGTPVLALSARRPETLDPLSAYMPPGCAVALLGSSGVGKTTVINLLLGEERRPTAEVRARDDRGRHTTTTRELFVLPGGALVIDTPGLRELQLWSGAGEGLRETFDDIEALAAGCRFADCTHRHEPRCAVCAAVDRGELAAGRLESYHKLQGELARLEQQRERRAELEARRRTRVLHRAARKHQPRR